MVDGLQVLFVHLQQGDPERGHLPLDLLQLGLFLVGLVHVLPGGFGGVGLGVVHHPAGVGLGVGHDDLRLVLGLLEGVLGQALGAEQGLLDAVLLSPVGLHLLGQDGQLLLGLGVFGGQFRVLGGQVFGLLHRGVPLGLELLERLHHFVDEVVHILRLVTGEAGLSETDLVDLFHCEHCLDPPIDISYISRIGALLRSKAPIGR